MGMEINAIRARPRNKDNAGVRVTDRDSLGNMNTGEAREEMLLFGVTANIHL